MTHEYQYWKQSSSLDDPEVRSSPNSDFEDRGLLKDVAVVESGPPPEFCPVLEGRLFTAHDSIIEANYEVHPTARLLYDSLPQEYRDVFKHCRMYLEKHLEFVKYLRYLSLDNLAKKSEPSSERDLIKSLGIPVSTEEGKKKKWQCGAVGCQYKGTVQHLVSHLRTKSHIGIATFACTLGCETLFHHSQDRDRHMKEKTCLKSRPVEDAAEPQGSTRSLRGVQDQSAAVPKPKVKSRVSQQLARGREYQIPAQTSTQGVNDPRTRKAAQYDPRFQAPGNGGHYNPGMPPTSFAPPQPSGSPVHLTHAYHQNNSNVPTTQDGHAGLHPVFHAPVTPDFFPTILPMNNGGMHAKFITNNNHIHSTADSSQPTSNLQFTPASQTIDPGVNQSTGLTYGHLRSDSRVATRYQNPGQSSTSDFANFTGNFYGDDPPRGSHSRPHNSRKPPPYQGRLFRRDGDEV